MAGRQGTITKGVRKMEETKPDDERESRGRVVVVKRKRRKPRTSVPAKRKLSKRKKNGIEGLLMAALEAILSAKKLYSKVKPMIVKKKTSKPKTKTKKKETKTDAK
jgi:hypothetical protein